jgi:hypothetical protein
MTFEGLGEMSERDVADMHANTGARTLISIFFHSFVLLEDERG